MPSYSHFLALILMWVLIVRSSTTEDINGINNTSSEVNNNRIKSKHLELWDIIRSVVERKETLEKISLRNYDKSDWNKSFGDKLKQLNQGSSNLTHNFYMFNIELSSFLLNELDKLAQMERDCQGLV